MGTEESKRVVLRFWEAMHKLEDIKELLDFLTDDATWWVIGSVPGISGTHKKQELPELIKKVTSKFASGGDQLILDHLIAEGDYVAAEVHTKVKTVEGKSYDQMYHFKFEVKEGKIRAVKEYNDTALMKEVILDG